MVLHGDKLALYFYVLFVDILTRWFDDFISMKFLIAVFLPASPCIPTTSPFINFENFCQPPRLLHPLLLLFWPKFVSLPVYSTLPFYLKLESRRITMHRESSYYDSVLTIEMKNKIPSLSSTMMRI